VVDLLATVQHLESCGVDLFIDQQSIDTTTPDVVMRARYIRTGPATFHTLEALERTCKSLRENVGALLRKAKVPVRL
jgi:hypothetical protein